MPEQPLDWFLWKLQNIPCWWWRLNIQKQQRGITSAINIYHSEILNLVLCTKIFQTVWCIPVSTGMVRKPLVIFDDFWFNRFIASICNRDLMDFLEMCHQLGIPMSEDKIVFTTEIILSHGKPSPTAHVCSPISTQDFLIWSWGKIESKSRLCWSCLFFMFCTWGSFAYTNNFCQI